MKPLVSFLTPTMNRAELHPQLHRGFAADLWPNKELVVLDESVKASPYFSKLRDPRVRYVHAPMVGARVVNRIGAARNRLVALSRGSFIEHRDDDDTYDPIWTQFGMERLGSADLLKLDVYRIITDPEPGQPAMIFEWDTRKFGGEHYALQGNEAIKSQVSPDELPPDVVSMFRDGYGYSIMGPRRTFERFPFPAEGTEDFAFLRAVRDSGGKIVFVSDAAHLVLHLVSKRSKSAVFPQRLVGRVMRKMVGAAPDFGPTSLHEFIRRRMLGTMSTMRELPCDKDIHVTPGVLYQVLASIKDKHPLAALSSQASPWGVSIVTARDNVPPSEFGVPAAPSGYRLVLVTAKSNKKVILPWSIPKLLRRILSDDTRCVKAWTSEVATINAAPRAAPTLRLMAGAR